MVSSNLDPSNVVPWTHPSQTPKQHCHFCRAHERDQHRQTDGTHNNQPRYSICSSSSHLMQCTWCSLITCILLFTQYITEDQCKILITMYSLHHRGKTTLMFVTVPRNAVIRNQPDVGETTHARASWLALQRSKLICRAAETSAICWATEEQAKDKRSSG